MRQGIIDLLKRLALSLDGANDREIARRLSVPKAYPAKWRSGRQAVDAASARAIAEILGDDPDLLELEVAAECATDPMAKESYLRVAETYRTTRPPVHRGPPSAMDIFKPGVGHYPAADARLRSEGP